MDSEKSILSADLDWMMQSRQVSDAQLIQVFVSEYYTWLYRMAFVLTGDTTRARMVVEYTLREAISNRRRFWGNTTLRAWLAELALQYCQAPGKKTSIVTRLPFLRSRISAALTLVPVESPDRLPQEYRSLREQIQALHSQDRVILLLRYVQGLTAPEIAYVLHLGESVILSHLHVLRENIQIGARHSTAAEVGSGKHSGGLISEHSSYFLQLHQALDRSLKEEDHHQLQQHLMSCQVCRTYSANLAELDHKLHQEMQACWQVNDSSGGDAETLTAGLDENVGKTRHQRQFSRLAKEIAMGAAAILIVLGVSSVGNLTAAEPVPTPPPANPVGAVELNSLPGSPDEIVETPEPQYPPRWRPDLPGAQESILGSMNSENTGGEYLNFTNRRYHLSPGRETPEVNMSGPVNLHLLLHYWGQRGNPQAYLQPNQKDETVMFHEMVDYVEEHTDLSVLMRMGGEISTLKDLLEIGLPVIIQKGTDNPAPAGWVGHYVIVNGYDNTTENFILLAAFPEDGEDLLMPYAELEQNWRAFNYSYMIVFPPERFTEVRRILGDQADEEQNYQSAAERASAETEQLSFGRDLFFAWYNLGTSLTYLEDYSEAKDAFDEAFSIFVILPEAERPWRILWYQTRPYWAYYHTGSYQAVIHLTTSILDSGVRPHLEESYYWRALAKEALGDIEGAIEDLNESVRLNPNFVAGKYQLRRINGES